MKKEKIYYQLYSIEFIQTNIILSVISWLLPFCFYISKLPIKTFFPIWQMKINKIGLKELLQIIISIKNIFTIILENKTIKIYIWLRYF